jgi:hypothetical protein
MIDLIFQFASEYLMIRIKDKELFFKTSGFGTGWGSIDGLKFNKVGVLKEYPDLTDNPQWQQIAIERFKAKIKGMSTEKEICDYIIEDLKKHGYVGKYKQQIGFRRVAI